MRLLFLGDIVGRTARQAVISEAAKLRSELALDFLIVNCENAAGGLVLRQLYVMICSLQVLMC